MLTITRLLSNFFKGKVPENDGGKLASNSTKGQAAKSGKSTENPSKQKFVATLHNSTSSNSTKGSKNSTQAPKSKAGVLESNLGQRQMTPLLPKATESSNNDFSQISTGATHPPLTALYQ